MVWRAINVPAVPQHGRNHAHRASQATNESEITKSVQLFQGLYGNYPDGYDLLTDGTTMVNYLPANRKRSALCSMARLTGQYAGGNVASPT